MGKIERAKKLLDAGALTPEEFEQEKARLLHDFFAEQSPGDGSISGSKRSRTLILSGLALLFLVTYAWVWRNASQAESPAASGFMISSLAEPSTDAEQVIAQATTSEPVDLTDALRFSDPAQCKAGAALENVFTRLDKARENGNSSEKITLDNLPDSLVIAVTNNKTAEGDVEQSSEIRFDQDAEWNGLRLSRIRTHLFAPPDSDSSYSRILTFRDEPSVVQRALAKAGFGAPLSPGYSELSDEVCGGSMHVEAVSGGAALTCGWGC
jgi:hypothetical protein